MNDITSANCYGFQHATIIVMTEIICPHRSSQWIRGVRFRIAGCAIVLGRSAANGRLAPQNGSMLPVFPAQNRLLFN